MAGLTVLPDAEAVARAAAERVTALTSDAIAAGSRPSVCLTGGSIARRVYEMLPTGPVDWRRVHLYWGDDRHVPPDHEDSNFKLAHDAFISRIAIPPSNVHPIPTELSDPGEAARIYEEEVRGLTFDVMLLGLGDDGHIASLFAGSDPLTRIDSGGLTPLVAVTQARLAPFVERITLTPPAILDSRVILMVVSGASKADAVHAGLRAPEDVARWPVHVLRAAADRVEWLVDEAAGSRLNEA
ncbi:MAG: 6-phosphogluconolactonase [Acidimicrobiia bacterium]|nr:6-phosphogluconolactonase [Acidimicrobiia bacterium]